ncbi:hypothetical protein C0Q70_14198 [Pomacea canaliculata]|uniref:Uncharacterized protein n=1 Tax=Pomacea canaliculata TaxID=400727 RepID=A0A2T7NZB9_POMCA|nr:hypothetical protein C0Q70_14198 [Pomacea canaliculata]
MRPLTHKKWLQGAADVIDGLATAHVPGGGLYLALLLARAHPTVSVVRTVYRLTFAPCTLRTCVDAGCRCLTSPNSLRNQAFIFNRAQAAAGASCEFLGLEDSRWGCLCSVGCLNIRAFRPPHCAAALWSIARCCVARGRQERRRQ